MSTVFVTGSTGFIGRAACRRLLMDGHSVRAGMRRVPAVGLESGIEPVPLGDIGEDIDWKRLIEGSDFLIHLAGLAHQVGVRGEGRMDEFQRVNALATRRLARAARGCKTLKRLLFISSIAAVGSASEAPISEQTRCSPDTDYGKSKLLAERAIEEELRGSEVDWCILRPALVYGPGNPGNMARLLRLIRWGLPIPLARLQNRRSFIYIGNLVDAMLVSMVHPGASRKTFVLADKETLSTPQLIKALAKASQRRVRLFPVPNGFLRALGRAGDLATRLSGLPVGIDSYSVERLTSSLAVDSSALSRATGWQPRHALEAALAQTVAGDQPALRG